jgi:hypothetical protein
MSILQIVATVLQAAAIVVTAFFASRSLHAWRGQLVGKRKFEIAEEILVSAYRLQGRLGHIRNPIAFGGEGKLRPRPEGPEAATARKDMYFVPLARLQEINEDFAQMSKARLLARVYFGADATAPFDAIAGVYNEIAVAARMLVNTAEDDRRAVSLELLQSWEATIWDTSGGTDALAQRVQKAVSEIETFCRPALIVDGAQRRQVAKEVKTEKPTKR